MFQNLIVFCLQTITKLLLVFKNLSVLLSILYTLTLTALSLIKINDVVSEIPAFNDKVTHGIAHFIFVIVWFVVFYYKYRYAYNKAISRAALFSISYGILIELLQGWITISRQSDFNDVFANTLGMVFAVLFLMSIKKMLVKKLE